jgi:Lrp/AsnC family transcriptional regulator, leucine-responsive regulatory protein
LPRWVTHVRLILSRTFESYAFLTNTFESGTLEAITDYEVVVLTNANWTPQVGGTDLAMTCAQCGNEVDDGGETLRINGQLYYLCCPSCKDQFETRYEKFSANA